MVHEFDLPLGVYRARAKGREYWYYQPGKGTQRQVRAQRVPGTPEDPAFWEFIASIRAGAAGPSVADIAGLWTQSVEFKALAANTQEHYRHYLGALFDAGFQGKLFDGVTQADLLRFRSSYGEKKVSANHAMTTCRELWKWAIPLEYATVNPAKEIPNYQVEHDGSDPWPMWAIDLALEHGDWPLRFGIASMAFTGQRGGDCVRMAKPDFDREKGKVRVIQEKTRKAMLLPLHGRFRPIVEEGLAREPEFFIPRRCGSKPVSTGAFRAYFNREIRKPALRRILEAELTLHGLRKFATCSLLEVGCTTAEVSAITGHSLAMIELYARMRNQETLAESAMEKWENAA